MPQMRALVPKWRRRQGGNSETPRQAGAAAGAASPVACAAGRGVPAFGRSRVFFVNRYSYPDESASSQLLFDLARYWAARGVQVHVICSRDLYEGTAKQLPANETVCGIRVHRVATTRFGRHSAGRIVDYLSFYVTSAVAMLRLVRCHDVLIAKTDPPLLSVVAAVVAWLRGARLVNWLQDLFPEVAAELLAKPLPRWINRALLSLRDRSLRAASHNVVLGSRMREHLLARGLRGDRLRIIANWANDDCITPLAAQHSRLRQRLGLTSKFVVGYSGNLGRAHDSDTFLAAARRLREHEDIVFLMIGGGMKMQALQGQVAASGLSNFIFMPYQRREELTDSMAAADVHLACLLPSLEGLIVPSKFYGILAAGRPTIFVGDPNGEVARIIHKTDCGAVVPCADAAGLANRILELKNNRLKLLVQGHAALDVFESRFTVQRALDQWTQVLAESTAGIAELPAARS